MLLVLFLYYLLILLIRAAFAQIFNPIAELVIPIGIPRKKVKAGIEIDSAIVEAKIKKCSI